MTRLNFFHFCADTNFAIDTEYRLEIGDGGMPKNSVCSRKKKVKRTKNSKIKVENKEKRGVNEKQKIMTMCETNR